MNFGATYVNEDVIMYIIDMLSEESMDNFLRVSKCAHVILSKTGRYIRYKTMCETIIKLASNPTYAYKGLMLFWIWFDNGISKENVDRISKNPIFDIGYNRVKCAIPSMRIISIIHEINAIYYLDREIVNIELDEQFGSHLEYTIDRNRII
jgi:hypothetical protein